MSLSKRRGAVLLVLAISLWLSFFATPSQAGANQSGEKLLQQLVDVRTALEWPGMNLPQAAGELGDAAQAYQFVKDGVTYVSYQDSYGGAAGTLRTRTGNSVDKSLLLAALLERMGYEVRLVRADWPGDAVPFQAPVTQQKIPALQSLSSRLETGGSENTHSPAAKFAQDVQTVKQEVDSSIAAIEKLLKQKNLESKLDNDQKTSSGNYGRSDRDWVWVQARKSGQAWTDFDLVFPKQARPVKFQKNYEPKTVTLTVRLMREKEHEPSEELLKWEGPVSELLGYDMALTFLPADENIESLSQVKDAAKIAQWMPQLQLGTSKIKGKSFSPQGKNAPAATSTGGGSPFGGGLFGGGQSKPKPKLQPSTAGGSLVLRFQLRGPISRRSSWSRYFSRVLHTFTQTFDSQRLISLNRIGYSVTAVPQQVAQARVVDELIDLVRMRRTLDGEKIPEEYSYQRGISSQTARAINTILATSIGLSSEGIELDWFGPTIFIDSVQLAQEKDGLYCDRRFDLLAYSYYPTSGAKRRDQMAWGLAICGTEARLLSSRSVNRNLLDTPGTLRVTLKSDMQVQPHFEDPDPRKAVLGSDGIVIHTDKSASSSWAIYRSGHLLGVLADSELRRQAKGSFERSRAAGVGYGALGTGALASMGAPSGMLVGGLVYYHIKLAEAYNKAAKTLDILGNAIESGDTSGLTNNARRNEADFRQLAQTLSSTLRSDAAQNYGNSLQDAGASGYLGRMEEGSLFGRRLSQAGPATGLSAGSNGVEIPASVIDAVLRYVTKAGQ